MARSVLGALILLSLLGAYAHAEDTKPEAGDDRPPTVDNKLLTLISLSYASAIYDTQTTMTTLKQCNGRCFEANPLMSPFVRSKASAYSYTMGLTSLSAFATYRLKKSGARWWWVPLAATSAVHFAAGIHNQAIRSPQIPNR